MKKIIFLITIVCISIACDDKKTTETKKLTDLSYCATKKELAETATRLMAENRMDAANWVWSKAVELDKNDPDLYYQRSSTYGLQNGKAKAILDLKKAIELDSTKSEYYHGLGSIYFYVDNDYKNAEIYLKAAININNKDSESFYLLSGIYANTSRWEMALKNIDKALEIDASNTNFWHTRALFQLKTGQNDEACQDLNNAKKLGMNSKEINPALLQICQ